MDSMAYEIHYQQWIGDKEMDENAAKKTIKKLELLQQLLFNALFISL